MRGPTSRSGGAVAALPVDPQAVEGRTNTFEEIMVGIEPLLVRRQKLVERETQALDNLVRELAAANALLKSQEGGTQLVT